MLVLLLLIPALLLGGAALYVGRVFDSQLQQARLAAAVEALGAQSIHFDAPLRASLLPRPRLHTGAARLVAEGATTGTEPMARWTAATLEFEWLPLLRRELRLHRLSVDGLRLDLQRQADGRSNWAAWTRPQAGGRLADALGLLEIRDGQVSMNDRQRQRRWSLSAMQMRAVVRDTARPQAFELDAELTSQRPAFDGRLALRGKSLIEAEIGRYALRDLALHLRPQSPSGQLRAAQLRGDLSFDALRDSLIAGLELDVADLAAQTRFEVTALRSRPRLAAALTVHPFNPRALMQTLGHPLRATRDRQALSHAGLSLLVQGDAAHLVLSNIRAQLDATRVIGEIHIDPVPVQPQVQFHLVVDQVDLDRYGFPEAGPDTRSENLLVELWHELQLRLKCDVEGELDVGKVIVREEQDASRPEGPGA